MKEKIGKDLQEIVKEFSLSQQAFAEGKVIDLMPLGEKIDKICKNIQRMPKEEAAFFDAPLQNLIKSLDVFIEEYEAFLDTDPPTNSDAAAAAYKKRF